MMNWRSRAGRSAVVGLSLGYRLLQWNIPNCWSNFSPTTELWLEPSVNCKEDSRHSALLHGAEILNLRSTRGRESPETSSLARL